MALPDMGCNECPVCMASELVFSECMLRAEANDASANICRVTVLLVNVAVRVEVNATPVCWRFLTFGQKLGSCYGCSENHLAMLLSSEALVKGRALFLTKKAIFSLGYVTLHLGVVVESVL